MLIVTTTNNMEAHMRNRNTELKNILFDKGITQRELARKSKIAEAIVSMIIHGKYVPDDRQRKKIAAVLRTRERDLFVQKS